VREQVWIASGRTLRPFSRRLGIPCRGASVPTRRALCDFASERAYCQAVKQLKEHYGVEASASMAAKCCMELGRELAGEENLSPATALPPDGADLLLLEIDGTMVPTLLGQSEQGDRRKGRTLGYKEMRLAAARDLAKSDPVYAAGFYEVEQAGAAWSRCALSAGWSMSTMTHAVVDGAEWIRSQHERHFSSFGRALSDCYHVCEYLAAAFPKEEDYLRNKARLLEERVEDLLLELSRLAAEESSRDRPETPAADALRYINNRYDSLFYAQARQAGLPLGSGLIESSHKHVLQSRLKIPGAWWKPGNANAMAKLRAAKANRRWDEIWSAKIAA